MLWKKGQFSCKISRPRIKNSKGQGHLKKGHFKKRARSADFGGGGGHPRQFKKGTNSNNYFPMGHIHRITTGHQELFLAFSVQISGRASRPYLRASEAIALD